MSACQCHGHPRPPSGCKPHQATPRPCPRTITDNPLGTKQLAASAGAISTNDAPECIYRAYIYDPAGDINEDATGRDIIDNTAAHRLAELWDVPPEPIIDATADTNEIIESLGIIGHPSTPGSKHSTSSGQRDRPTATATESRVLRTTQEAPETMSRGPLDLRSGDRI